MSEKNYEFQIKRKDDDGNVKYQNYEVPKDQISTVLEGLLYIKENLDQTLSFRYSCRMEICGSCSMEINGKPKMGCSTIVANLGTDKVKVEPMKHYNVVKDLVVELDPFFEKYKRGLPYIVREKESDYKSELPQTPEQFLEYEQYSMCIKCGLCMSACPIVGTDEQYMGPAPLAAVLRYNLDNRDQGSKYRLEIVNGDEGTSRCHFAGECSEACPKDVDPSFAIQILRKQGFYYEFKKIFGRS